VLGGQAARQKMAARQVELLEGLLLFDREVHGLVTPPHNLTAVVIARELAYDNHHDEQEREGRNLAPRQVSLHEGRSPRPSHGTA
jgi:hypothetical protein